MLLYWSTVEHFAAHCPQLTPHFIGFYCASIALHMIFITIITYVTSCITIVSTINYSACYDGLGSATPLEMHTSRWCVRI